MPYKFKKTNIQYDIDKPEEGYIIMGFDENGTLVTKNEEGIYEPIVNDQSTGEFTKLQVDYLTVGNRVSGVYEGVYSIAQGTNISANGDTSFAQGNTATASGIYSRARGLNVEANAELAYISGRGGSSAYKLFSSGKNSFVHMYSTSTSAAYGSLADYSVILGGINHSIGTNSTSSVILGGTGSSIGTSITGSIVLGGVSQTATEVNMVYVPRLTLTSTSSTLPTRTGAIYFNGSGFYGYTGSAKRLDLTVSNPGTNRLVTTNSSGDLNGQPNLTYNGTTFSISGTFSGSALSVSGNISGGSISGGSISGSGLGVSGDISGSNLEVLGNIESLYGNITGYGVTSGSNPGHTHTAAALTDVYSLSQNDVRYCLESNNLSDVTSASTAFNNIKQNATSGYAGVTEYATSSETSVGTSTNQAVYPYGFRYAWRYASNLDRLEYVWRNSGSLPTGTLTSTTYSRMIISAFEFPTHWVYYQSYSKGSWSWRRMENAGLACPYLYLIDKNDKEIFYTEIIENQQYIDGFKYNETDIIDDYILSDGSIKIILTEEKKEISYLTDIHVLNSSNEKIYSKENITKLELHNGDKVYLTFENVGTDIKFVTKGYYIPLKYK